MRVTKMFTFDAGHRLSDYEGKCKRLHGHTYKLEVTLEGKVDKLGMVVDFGELKNMYGLWVETKFDHKMILKMGDSYNEKLAKSLPEDDESICWVEYNPTAENMANDIFNIFKGKLKEISYSVKIIKVRLYETPTSYAEVI